MANSYAYVWIRDDPNPGSWGLRQARTLVVIDLWIYPMIMIGLINHGLESFQINKLKGTLITSFSATIALSPVIVAIIILIVIGE